jgi:alpha-L-fucosidase 2
MKLLFIFLFTFLIPQFAIGQEWFNYRNASSVVSKYRIIFTEPPSHIPSTFSVDAPLLGNGSTGVAISGASEKQVFYFSRNDFWRLKSSYNESFPCVLGKLELNMPAFKNATYSVEQDLYTATTYLKFSKNSSSIEIKMYVAAKEDLLIMELKNKGKGTIKGDLILKIADEETAGFQSIMNRGIKQNIQWISRQFDNDVEIPTKAACAMKIMDTSSNRFNLPENENLYVALSFSSNFKSADCSKHVLDRANAIDKKDFFDIFNDHKTWWSQYWNKSFIIINDSLLELDYYRSLYIMGSCSRDLEFPPGIFGTWVTMERPEWNGDYHLNYNYQSPFYALFSSNRIEQALPYNSPILAMIEKGREYGRKIYGIDGIHMPVGIGPKGMEITKAGPVAKQIRQFYFDHGFFEDGGLFFFQKSNALHCVPNMAMLFYHTYDKIYAQLVYPYIKGVVEFWEKYLKYEKGRYVIYNDAVQEGPNGDVNPILTLGFLRLALQTLIDISGELNIDQDKNEKWNQMLSKLSKFPTYINDGKTLFAASEKGWHSCTDHSNLCQIIFPGGQIHLDSEKNLLQTARNTMLHDLGTAEWYHTLHTNSSYPSLVRLGLNPDTIYNELKYFIENFRGPNGYLKEYMVGIETCSTTPSTINEMLLRSHPFVINVFPVWNKEKYAFFQDLRAEGAFLVSSLIQDGKVQWIKITSEQGRDCNIVNPWKAKTISVIRNGKDSKINVGKRFTLKTSKNDILIIMPWDWADRNN